MRSAICLPFGIGAWVSEIRTARAAALAREDSPKFKQAISTAIAISVAPREPVDLAHGPLTYPPHCMVVYHSGPPGSAVNWLDESARKYHYACPHEWLATTKEGVKLVALVSYNTVEAIGEYDCAGCGSAYRSIWDVVLVDLAAQRVIAVTHIYEYDPSHLDNPFSRNHSSWPRESEVVSAIRECVTFPR